MNRLFSEFLLRQLVKAAPRASRAHQLPTKVPRFGHGLVIAPHSDDECLGCFHLLRQRESAHRLTVAILTTKGSHDERHRESASALREVPIEGLDAWAFKDGEVAGSIDSLKQRLREQLDKYDVFFSPAPNDVTPDHVVVANAVLDVIPLERVIWYRSTYWTFGASDADFVITGSSADKKRTLSNYRSQRKLALGNAVEYSVWEAKRIGMEGGVSLEAFQYASSNRLRTPPLNTLSLRDVTRMKGWPCAY